MCDKMTPANLNIHTLASSLVKISSSISPGFYWVWFYAYPCTYFLIQKLHFSLCFSKQNRSMYCVKFKKPEQQTAYAKMFFCLWSLVKCLGLKCSS